MYFVKAKNLGLINENENLQFSKKRRATKARKNREIRESFKPIRDDSSWKESWILHVP